VALAHTYVEEVTVSQNERVLARLLRQGDGSDCARRDPAAGNADQARRSSGFQALRRVAQGSGAAGAERAGQTDRVDFETDMTFWSWGLRALQSPGAASGAP
jgi:hypothetical protein